MFTVGLLLLRNSCNYSLLCGRDLDRGRGNEADGPAVGSRISGSGVVRSCALSKRASEPWPSSRAVGSEHGQVQVWAGIEMDCARRMVVIGFSLETLRQVWPDEHRVNRQGTRQPRSLISANSLDAVDRASHNPNRGSVTDRY